MEENEMNVFVHAHLEEGENSTADIVAKHNKSGFRNFVEESTLRNISLDELEELSDAGCSSRIDGNLRRTSMSSISSEPPRFELILEWNISYLNELDGIIRIALLVCSVMSLLCLTSAGDKGVDILEMPFSLDVRAHIFVSVLTILIGGAFLFLGISSLGDSFPIVWNICDAAIHICLCCFFAFSSTLLIVSEENLQYHKPPISEWTKVMVASSVFFGFLSTLSCFILAILRGCVRRSLSEPTEIMMTSLSSSSLKDI